MSQRDYSHLLTERVHEGLNLNRNHRFFLVYGRLTADEFLTQSMCRTSLRETLWATLKANHIERVVFYNAVEKFFFLDDESSRFAQHLGRDASSQQVSPAPRSRRKMQGGPLGNRNVLKGGTRMVARALEHSEASSASSAMNRPTDASNDNSFANEPGDRSLLPRMIRMAPARGGGRGMSDAAVLTTLNDFIQDHSVRTAVVIEDLENLSRHFDDQIRDQLAARLRDWNALTAENRNVLFFITSREPVDEHSMTVMRNFSDSFSEIANLVRVALGERQMDAEGFIWCVPPPYQPEIERMVDELRLKHDLSVEWAEHERVIKWLTAENKSFKDLDGVFTEYLKLYRKRADKISLELLRRRGWVHSDSDPRSAMERLDQMIGMSEIKDEVRRYIDYLQAQKRRQVQNPELRSNPPSLHLVLTGNPGTGKTTVARLIGEIYRDLGLLKRGHTKECDSSNLVEGYVGQTAPKTNAVVNEALDGVLFIDEAYVLTQDDDPFGKQAVTTLLARMENERHRLAVIVAGYPEEMQEFLASNPGLAGRFSTKIELRDYYPDELLQIFELMVNERGHTIDEKMRETMSGFFNRMYEWRANPNYFELDKNGKSTYRNAGTVRVFVEAMLREQAHRLSGEVSTELSVEDIPERYRPFLGTLRQSENADQELKQAMDELNSLIGLQPVKKMVERLVIEQQLAISLQRDLNASDKTRHMLFTGNPGTGKTTIARLIGRIYKALGLLRKGHFTEANHTELVGQYIGETAQKTKQVLDSALDGVLFIDEAYSLSQSKHSYGLEAINTLVPALESYRNNLVVIFAGYTLEMEDFVSANSGIASRIGRTIEFPDYSTDELVQIFHAMAHAKGYDVSEGVDDELQRQFEYLTRDDDSARKFGNARGVRVQFFDKMIDEFDSRMYEALKQGQDARTYPRSFVLSDVPRVVGKQKQPPIPSSGRTYKFRVAELANGQDQLTLPGGDIPERVAKSVGLVKTDKGTGTGFIVSPYGHLLTAYHVVEGSKSIQFRINGSREFHEVTYLDGDKDADLVVLKLEGDDWPFTPIVQQGYELSRGTALGLLGYPMGESLGTEVTYTSGDLSSTRRSAAGVRVFQIDVSAYSGNSGGPVFLSQTGEAIGVLSGGPNDTLNFAVSLEELYERFR